MVLYRITIRKKNTEYQLVIPPKVVKLLKELEVERGIMGHTHQIPGRVINVERDRKNTFEESLVEGMNQYHGALKNLVDR